LLGREHAGRREAYAQFRSSWERFAAEGMREALVGLSVTLLPAGAPSRESGE
jgi:hypothetical protein